MARRIPAATTTEPPAPTPRKRTSTPRAPRKPAAPKSLPQVVAEGNHLASLIALRDYLAAQLLTAERDVPAIARQLTNVLNEIAAIPAPDAESKLDDLANRRAARKSAATGS